MAKTNTVTTAATDRSDASVDDSVLDAAATVFRAHGFLGSSVQQLVAATGRSRSALYGTYGDKAGLFSATLAWYVDTRVTIAVVPGVSPARHGLDDLGMAGGGALPCLLVRSCLELADLPESAVNCVTETMERQWDAIIDSESINGDQAFGTVELALRYGTALLAGVGVPTDILYAAADIATKQRDITTK